METTLSIISPRPSPPPPPTTDPRHLLHRRNVQNQAPLPMPLIDPTILRHVTTKNSFRFRLKNHVTSSIRPKFMADEPKKTDSHTAALTVGERRDEEKIGSEKKTDPPVPPPPEKPLPGDCCGSGCVRCVWDVYYEELEEYDKLYKAN